jgi:hypothetical protein
VSRGEPLGLADRLELRELVDAYAMAADHGDGDWFRTLWLPDARLTVHEGGSPAEATFTGLDALARIPALLGRYALTLHVVANHLCRTDPESDGGAATGEAYCLAHHVSAPPSEAEVDAEAEAEDDRGEQDDYVMAIRYVDRYGRDGDGRWRFATREVRRQWTKHEPVRTRAGGPT